MKVAKWRILKWRIQKSNYFFPIFLFSSSFLPQLVKCLEKWANFFFLRFSWKLPYSLSLIWKIQKSNLFFQIFIFSSFFFFFASTSQKCLKKWVNFFLKFPWKLPYNLILIWKIKKSNSFFQNVFIFIFIFASISQKCFNPN